MNKNILNRILKLEKIYETKDFNKEEYINEIILEIESIFEYTIRERINFKEIDYKSQDIIARSIFKFLTKEELRYIAYYPNYKKPCKTNLKRI